jgi:C4-dicarboxylate-specific signal transduction histidine kinase
MLGWLAGSAALLTALRQLLRQRVARRRAEQLLQLGQVARLNTLGELAAGMAELNQPLTAVLASSQAAQRLLAEDAPDMTLRARPWRRWWRRRGAHRMW